MEADKEIVVLALDAKNIAKDLEEGFSYPLLEQLRSVVEVLEAKASINPTPEAGALLGEVEALTDRWDRVM